MSWLMLSDIAQMANGELIGNDVMINAVSTDSRAVKNDEIFIALVGERFDAHDFIADFENKAAAIFVSKQMDVELPQVLVDDTRLAMGRLAAAWRQRFTKPVIGLTGSNGKTTLKEMLTAVLSQNANVLATKGNLNNDIGMPLTLLEIREEHEFAVIEMGANHFGEIAYLTNISRPDIAVINNAGPAHLEGFGDIKGVSRAKGEIFNGLSEEGIAVINQDDTYAEYWVELNTERRIMGFGLQGEADVTGQYHGGGKLTINSKGNTIEVQLNLLGKHNAMNALAATALASVLNIELTQIKQGLESLQAVPGRLALQQGQQGITLIDDTYNANPSSAKAGIDVLAEMSGSRMMILGDMGELGDDVAALHGEIGVHAKQAGIESLFCLGEYSKQACAEFGEQEHAFDDLDEMLNVIKSKLQSDMTILVKGSRSMRMERVISALQQPQEGV
ncbi:MAG: UDP-N-acetylmuramoylalanyl-D-glutamyl-2,6-diaminopimelate--D-alanyl-D-alanine ligase (EC [uncultured Thiotrichaceae bacterium]|uniref:UDP-N-acetylmuramoyl-tripeptide--D-alanyl-D-alanine ligase n=1 Tax=uncultured Thiotrichaceae bacterium TaxID=298394 RepID=A0A6S6TDJ7_9GAMM|nr:MAG: UDP-N-acetylmuramoylalanyl-D-glutamyl-2,6-diaminopimelate--D-alanyl-D-alanine ligase (EC [uncultured Thiotrichaceae bacterium]